MPAKGGLRGFVLSVAACAIALRHKASSPNLPIFLKSPFDLIGTPNGYQDARDVQTKGAKTFQTYFLPVGDDYLTCFSEWVDYLRDDLLYGHEDALFPKPAMGHSFEGGYSVVGLSRDNWSNGTKIRDIIKTAFTNAGLPEFAPHSFRKTLVKYGVDICPTPESFKAWSLNLGHESVVTTLSAYCPISVERQKELIRGMAENRLSKKL